MRSLMIFGLLFIFFSVSLGNAGTVEGIVKKYGFDSENRRHYVEIISNRCENRYYFIPETLYIANASTTQILDEEMASGTIYSLNYYPRQAKLFLNDDGYIRRMDVWFLALRGTIQEFSPNSHIVKIRKTSRDNRKMIYNTMAEHLSLPDMDPWRWKRFADRNDLKFTVGDDAIVRYNYKRINRNEIGGLVGKRYMLYWMNHSYLTPI